MPTLDPGQQAAALVIERFDYRRNPDAQEWIPRMATLVAAAVRAADETGRQMETRPKLEIIRTDDGVGFHLNGECLDETGPNRNPCYAAESIAKELGRRLGAEVVETGRQMEAGVVSGQHEFVPGYSGMACVQMVMREDYGDACGLRADDPVHTGAQADPPAGKLKSNHQCRLCGFWLEGAWNRATDEAYRASLQRQMDQGHCDTCAPPPAPEPAPEPPVAPASRYAWKSPMRDILEPADPGNPGERALHGQAGIIRYDDGSVTLTAMDGPHTFATSVRISAAEAAELGRALLGMPPE